LPGIDLNVPDAIIDGGFQLDAGAQGPLQQFGDLRELLAR